MSARDKLHAYAGTPCVLPENMLDEALDAYRVEVLAKAIGRLRAIPVTCTALTGPVWYGTGWDEAITELEEIADYQKPDDEAYPGELQQLRALALAARAAIRKDSFAEVKRVIGAHQIWEDEATRCVPAPEFFQPGRTYQRRRWLFQCLAVAPSPFDGEARAVGFLYRPGDNATVTGLGPDNWDHDGWTEATEAGEASA